MCPCNNIAMHAADNKHLQLVNNIIFLSDTSHFGVSYHDDILTAVLAISSTHPLMFY